MDTVKLATCNQSQSQATEIGGGKRGIMGLRFLARLATPFAAP